MEAVRWERPTKGAAVQAYKHVTVNLSKCDGNAYAIIGAVARGLEAQADGYAIAKEWKAYAESSESYDQLIQRAMEVVTVV
jgi:hypothetical protein